MLRIGKYPVDAFVAYLRKYPELMHRVMRLLNDFDPGQVERFFSRLDLTAPPPGGLPAHRRYVENQAEIHGIIQRPDSYPEKFQNLDYLSDERVRKAYGRGATTYDELWSGAWPYELRQEVVGRLELFLGSRLLEVGIGTGTNMEALPDSCEVTGIDLCPEMLLVAGEKANRRPSMKVDLRLMDACQMSFPDSSFDRVLAFYALCGTRDPGGVLAEMSRVCKPGGTIVIFDVIRSKIDEVALLQYLFRPVAREMGAVYLEFCPPYAITYDSFLDLFPLIEHAGIRVEQVKTADPYGTATLIQAKNAKVVKEAGE